MYIFLAYPLQLVPPPQVHSALSVLTVNILSHAFCLFPAPGPVILSYEKHKSEYTIPLLKVLILFQEIKSQFPRSIDEVFHYNVVHLYYFNIKSHTFSPDPKYTNIILSVLIRLSFLDLWAFAHTIPFTEHIHSVLLY